jgi:hypothetical protein
MPKVLIYESRRLIVPLETAVDAALELDRERGGALSRARIVEARIETGEEAGLVLAVQHPDALTVDQRKYPLPAIAAALIHYCWKAKIPIPRSGTKSIEVVPEGFALTIQVTDSLQRRHGPLPQTSATGSSAPADDSADDQPGEPVAAR